jgi:acyl-CoA dehydrogenase
MRRDIFTEEHDIFRDAFRRFAEKAIAPKVAGWNEAGITDRETWRAVGAAGFLGAAAPEAYGGAGADFLYDAILIEEMASIRAHPLMMSLHSDVILPYILEFGSEEQKQRWAPGCILGETILAVGMTEPGTGSDLASIRTTALRDGDDYIINGSKTFISNGQLADLVVLVVKTDPDATPPRKGISLIVVEAGTPGFERGRNLAKLGLKGQDTSELHFEDCRVPVGNLLGEEGRGFYQLMNQLQQERMTIAVGSIASSRRALDDTIEYTKGRKAFGKSVASFQATQFKLAELATQVEIGQAFVDNCLRAHVRGDKIQSEVSMAKWWTTDLQKRLTSDCLQLHGGYGFMAEYPISQDYADAAVQTIYAGTNEIMKVLIARGLGLPEA